MNDKQKVPLDADDGDGKNKGGRPRRELTDQQKAQIETLAGLMTQDQMADFFNIPKSTFKEILGRDEEVSGSYKRGRADLGMRIAQNLAQKALEGDFNAQRLYLNTQCGWSEHSTVEQTAPPQIVVLGAASPDEMKAAADFANKSKDDGE